MRVRTGDYTIWQAPDCNFEFTPESFSAEYWRTRPGFEPVSGGRGGSCLIEIDGDRAILRQYYRGGLAGKLGSDRYLWLGNKLTRPWREWAILERARGAGLPVPEPLAACVCRRGPSYRAALITAFLEDTETLTQRLARGKLKPELWHRLGVLIRQLQAEGIRHADLNADNVLVDSRDRFYLIDFDKARIMRRLDDWQWRPLYRLQRSIAKRNLKQPLSYGEDDWQALMDGYQAS